MITAIKSIIKHAYYSPFYTNNYSLFSHSYKLIYYHIPQSDVDYQFITFTQLAIRHEPFQLC